MPFEFYTAMLWYLTVVEFLYMLSSGTWEKSIKHTIFIKTKLLLALIQ